MNPKKPRNNCLNCGEECTRYNQIYCSNSCQNKYQREQKTQQWLNGERDGTTIKGSAGPYPTTYVVQYMLKLSNNSCEECGWNKKHSISQSPLVQIHHIDGNRNNNARENLKVLCPNCHALTNNWMNHGK